MGGGLTLATAAAAAGPVAVAHESGQALLEGAPLTPAEALTLVISLLALAVLAWLWLTTTLAVLATVPSAVGRWAGRGARRLTPRTIRHLVVLAVGLALASGPATAAAAAPTAVTSTAPGARGPSPVGSAPDPALRALDPPTPGWVPTVPTHRPQPSPDLLTPRPRPTPADELVVVRRGDTLWAIAARHLGAEASTAEVAAAWPRWYAANRQVIGPDPDLIRPGQRLRAPAGAP